MTGDGSPLYSPAMSRPYDFVAIEAKWQRFWQEQRTFRALDPGDEGFDAGRPKFYVMDMFPYPSGAGLHVGHPLGYIATDIVARYKRMQGFNVLHPMGFDAFGLPAEQYAIEHGIHPRITTERNIENMRRQLKAFGLSYDWDREVRTIDPEYYRWTQWIFLQLFKSYFDPDLQKARPLSDLEDQLHRGERMVSADLRAVAPRGGAALRAFADLDPKEQQQVLDNHRLAYLAEVPVNWCPALGTVLANEEVTAEGRSERGNHSVFKRPLKQWMLRITAYAERLTQELDLVDWPEPIRLMQRNWVGRSEGATVRFAVESRSETIDVFTTRPDTLFGATYMVLAPEHPLVDQVTTAAQSEAVAAYQKEAAQRSELDRQAEAKRKTGVFTGGFARNPVNDQRIPIWVADYVLMGYGTGAIMAVPAHDQRDFEFARQFGLSIVPVVMPQVSWLAAQARACQRSVNVEDTEALRADYLVSPADYGEAATQQAETINSANDEVSLNGLRTDEAKRTITQWLESKGRGTAQVQYKLRDWLFARQRYWGEPIPILHDEKQGCLAVQEDTLPVALPEMEDFSPPRSDDPDAPPQPSLSRADEAWREVVLDGRPLLRELNTMPQWAGSCWYYLRYIDPQNNDRLVDAERERYWMGENGVDLYVGGAEHAVLHLLYARFWHKVLFDLGHVSTPEPFGKLVNQGYILAAAYTDERGAYVAADAVSEMDGAFFYQGQRVQREFGKMGKSLRNAINPDDLFEEYGCDTLRLYEMYMGPIESSKPWNTRDIVGVNRFLQRVWRNFFGDQNASGELLVNDDPADDKTLRLLHKTIQRVGQDMERMRFNTALAALIELNNALVGFEKLPRCVAEPLVLMLAPLAPHIAEELWQALGHSESIAFAPWPKYDSALTTDAQIEIVIQVSGKTRGKVSVAADADEETVKAAALGDEKIAKHVGGKTVRRVVYVPGRLLNIVAN